MEATAEDFAYDLSGAVGRVDLPAVARAACRRAIAAEAEVMEFRRLVSALRNASDDASIDRAMFAIVEHAKGNGWDSIPPPVVERAVEDLEAANARVEALEERVKALKLAIGGMLLSTDASWEANGLGQDWSEACEAARRAYRGEGK